MVKQIPIEKLVEDGVLSKEASERLKSAWVTTCDEIYARVKEALEKELGIAAGSLQGFAKYIEAYVSPEVVNAPRPKRYPMGLLASRRYAL
jgi:hypothetical protein